MTSDPRRDDPLATARRLDPMTTVPGEREVRTGNAGRAGEPEPRERTTAASEGTPATSDPLATARRLKRQADLDEAQERAKKALHWAWELPTELPFSVTEHFHHDWPALVAELRATREWAMVAATALQACRDPWYSAEDHISPDGCPEPACPACERQEEEARELARGALNAYDEGAGVPR